MGSLRCQSARAYKGRVPVVLASCKVDLDEADATFVVAGTGSRRKSPFQLLQEFLNASPECVWGLCANGLRLRLARDAETLTRPSYLEFDLESLLGEARYPDFAALWRTLHASRAGNPDSAPTACVWESWRAQGQAQGMRVRDGLRSGVTAALKELGQGLLQAPQNDALRTALRDGFLTPDGYFQELLRTVYRFLFLYTVEERDILATSEEEPSPTRRTARTLYVQGYSMRRLRDRCRRLYEFDTNADLWMAVGIVFRGLAHGESRLDLPALGGLFALSQCPHLDVAVLENRFLLKAQQHLRWAALGGAYMAVDYRNMGPEELGSVYESLLELVPKVDLTARSFSFIGLDEEGSTAGNARKTTGSYYTPDALVQQLLKTALDPVIENRLAANATEPAQALLTIRVIDPACGSGHFLLAAARRLAERLAQVRSDDGVVKPAAYRHALREVIAHCIHGVDRNPMALELARTALWLEGFEPGLALSFLDHHLVCGDALLGVMDFKQVEMGIPQEAYKALSGDDSELCKAFTKANKTARKALADLKEGGTLFLPADRKSALAHWTSLEAMPDATPEEAEAKAKAYQEGVDKERHGALAQAADLFVGTFLAPKTGAMNSLRMPTTATLQAVLYGIRDEKTLDVSVAVDMTQKLCSHARVLHWPLAFPQVFAAGGFDCVLGNPPWEVSQLSEIEYFSSKDPQIALLLGHDRKSAIENLSESNPKIWAQYLIDKRISESSNIFFRESGRFNLSAIGKINTYALFAEAISQLRGSSGRAGFIVPSGISTDDSTKSYFNSLVDRKQLSSLFDFENKNGIFDGVHRSFKFCLLTLGNALEGIFSFYLTSPDSLRDSRRVFPITAEDFKLINPNTRTCPIFRSEQDATLTKKVYRRLPVLIEEETESHAANNPWKVSFRQGLFNMTSASKLFHENKVSDETKYLPLYEAKMIHQFDHRWATYVASGNTTDTVDVTLTQKKDSNFDVSPRYWVEEKEVLARIARVPHSLAKAYAAGDARKALYALAVWVEETVGEALLQDPRQAVVSAGGKLFESLPAVVSTWRDSRVKAEVKEVGKLTEAELSRIQKAKHIEDVLYELMDLRSPRWLMGWRDICRATDERTVIASVIPRAAVGDTFLLLFSEIEDKNLLTLLLADQNSLVHDFVARQKIGGTHLKYHYKKQITILKPDQYSNIEARAIRDIVLELTYTSNSLKPWAEEIGFFGSPFIFDINRRMQLLATLNAYYAKLYGLSREELRYVLDPHAVLEPDYPSETFRGLKNNEMKEFGEYRTQRLVLEAWDALP